MRALTIFQILPQVRKKRQEKKRDQLQGSACIFLLTAYFDGAIRNARLKGSAK
jgi:uncharacterized protein with PQ loop repeat